MPTYGQEFAGVYNDQWAYWGAKMWPFLAELVRRDRPEAATWLDLCCGTGSLLKRVSRAGYAATGVDRSRPQLAHARRNAPRARLVAADIRRLALGQRFDVVTCLFDSFNYLTATADLRRAFRVARRHLAPGGIFAFDMNTFAGLQSQWCRTSATHERHRTLIMETSVDVPRALGRCVITGFVRDGAGYRRFREEHVERGYRPREIEALLRQTGFQFRKLDGYTLGPARRTSGRLVYVCRAG